MANGIVEQEHEDGRRGFLGGVETVIEQLLFKGRWLLAPLYLGLLVGLLVIVVKFVVAMWHLIMTVGDETLASTTLGVLEILDIALLGNLIVLVIFSGYENFVSKIGAAENSKDRPSWMGKVDFSSLKIKLIGSLVAISVIELLKDFMSPQNINGTTEIWRIAIHLTFVVSGVLFAVMDYIADKRAIVDMQAESGALKVLQTEKEMGLPPGTADKLVPTQDSNT